MDKVKIGSILEGLKVNEARKEKPFFGYVAQNKKSYAVNIDGIDNDFPTSFSKQIEGQKVLKDFMAKAKSTWVSNKGKKNGMAEVKKWVKSEKPSQFYASWNDDKWYKDDSVEIHYIK